MASVSVLMTFWASSSEYFSWQKDNAGIHRGVGSLLTVDCLQSPYLLHDSCEQLTARHQLHDKKIIFRIFKVVNECDQVGVI